MATLEIHDDRGQVRRVTVSREHPALFGSSPDCDIVLSGSGVLPIHGRLRYKAGRFKVDASPEALAIERNGKKVKTASFRIGDEVRVGPFRIFMINPESGPLDEKTRVHAPPPPAPPPPATAQPFENPSWLKELAVSAPSVEVVPDPGEPPARRAEPLPRGADASYDRAYQEAIARRHAQAQATVASAVPR